MTRAAFKLMLIVVCLCCAGARGQPGSTVLYVVTERVADQALGYRHFPNFARLGFGTSAKPWHVWYGGGVEMRPVVYLPGYKPGAHVRVQSTMLIGSRFNGKSWDNAFAALASFDRDGNGIVEGPELRDLYVWVDFDGDGTIANREDALRPAAFYYTGFDLRAPARIRAGHAREGRIQPYSVFVPYTSRINLLELDVGASYGTRRQGYLSHTATGDSDRIDLGNPLNGWWRWTITNAQQWQDATRPWGKEAAGKLLLAVSQRRVHGMVQFIGPHEDRVNLPLEGIWRDGKAQWTSVSPLGLTRSEAQLESLYGYPVLRGRSWSNRNGKVREWTWEARHDRPLD